MSILQKLGEIFGCLIFSLAFGFLIVFIALANFTQYTTLQPIATSLIEKQLTNGTDQNQLNALFFNLTEQCKLSSTAIVPLNDNNQVNLKCEDIKNSNSSDVPHLIAITLFNQTYYKSYDCAFIDCIKGLTFETSSNAAENQKFTILTSAKANEFFSKNQIFLIVATIVGIILIIVSVRVWYNILKAIGITMLLIGITYLFISLIKSQLSHMFENQNLSVIIDTLFAPISDLLKISLILGIVLTIIGYVASYLMKKPEGKKN